jgi:hypothetical protein
MDALLVINALNRGEAQGPLVGFRLAALDVDGNPLPNNRVRVGDEFVLQIYVQDLRPSANASGVFAAFMDVEYSNEDLFSLGGTKVSEFSTDVDFQAFWTQGPSYRQPAGSAIRAFPWTYPAQPNGLDGDGVPYELDEVGSISNAFFLDGAEYKLLNVRLTAEQPGVLTFMGNPAEISPQSDVLLFGVNEAIPSDLVDYGLSIDVTITQPVNAVNDTASVLEDGIVTINVLANDFLEEGSTGTLAILPGGFSGPSNGTVTIVNGQVRYTPAPNYFGVDTFTYTAIDGLGNSDTATVTVTVQSVNDPPIAVNDSFTGILEDSVNNVLNVLANDSPGPGEGQVDSISLVSVTAPSLGGTAVISGDVILYTPAPNFFGAETFTYTIADSFGLTASATVTVQVDNVNDPPIALDDTFSGILEDSVNNVLNVLVNDSPGPGEELVDSITIQSFGPTSAGGTVTIAADGKSLRYTPAPNFFGTETFVYTIVDTGGLTDTALVTVNVVNVNDAPIAADDLVFVDEFSLENELFLLDNDSPGPGEEAVDSIRIIAVSASDKGGTITIAADGKSVFYTPPDDLFGPETDTFEYTIADNAGLTDTAIVTVEIEPVTRPRARDDRYSVLEDSLLSDNLFDVMANDLFNEGATPFPVIIVTPPQHGTADVVFNLFIRYQPNPNYFGPDTIEYQINDSAQGSLPDIGLVRINVLPVNDPPIAVDDTYTGIQEDSLNNVLNVLVNDSPGPGEESIDSITVQSVGATSSGGTVTIAADGKSLRYTPAPNFFGTETFEYTIVDTGGLTDTATVTVTVDNVNDPPIALDDTYTGIQEDSVNNVLNVLVNDSPGPGEELVDSITIQSVGPTSAGGTVTIAADGKSLSYTSAPDFFGTETFVYTIVDTGGLTDTATVTVVVDNVNDPPIARDDEVMALKDFVDQPLTGLLDNDAPGPDNEKPIDSIRIVAVGNFSHGGSATISADGQTIFYTPAPGFEGLETFEYTIEDEGELTATATVTVDVIDAVPSDISGVVYMDVNNSGTKEAQEIALAGVEVTLTGTNIRGQAVNITTRTDVNGVFTFKDILPNISGDLQGYSIHASQAEFTVDGKDSIVDNTNGDDFQPGIVGNDVVNGIQLGVWGTQRSQMNYAFGERGLQAKFITIAQYLSSTRKGLAIATDLNKSVDSDDYWFTVLQDWNGISHARVKLAHDFASAELTVWNQQGQSQTRTIGYRQYHLAGDQATGQFMIYFNGSAADLGFDILGGGLAMGGEGEFMDVEAGSAADYARGVDAVFASGQWA